MKIGIPKEIHPGERRVAATPMTAAKMRKLGFEVVVEAGAGEAADFTDGAYVETGAVVVPDAASVWSAADVVLKVRAPEAIAGTDAHEADLVKEGALLISFVWPSQHPSLVDRLAERKLTVLAMDAVPRITRAQKMDALSAMANIVGYRAVIEAASNLGRPFGGQITAAGRIPPAKVLIIGAGVAGLAAVACAKSLGALVQAFDTRPAVREQVESLGASFLEFEFKESGEGEGGYAKEMSEAYIAAEQTLIAQNAEGSDVVVCTALVPGKTAPILLTSGAVVSMQHGSVVVDLAAEQGGNCALTERDRMVEKFGKRILGFTDLASRMARQSSDLYSTTVFNLLADVYDPKSGKIALDLEDEVHRGCVVLQDGKLLWPPPTRPRPRSAAPPPESKAKAPAHGAAQPAKKPSRIGPVMFALVSALLIAAGLTAGGEFLEHLTVFLLAVVVGWHVIWNVNPALHTPLMSVTNAISGIILVGGILLMRTGGLSTATLLAAVAILIATINVSGGFLVTSRMLRMFRR
ncbi:MAG TPA: Re/Si-specific NAD(P)(+) transhydrogenase subunit alpha [Polyangiaceae bacterium]|jgi:NAD(P) transhydrogenase subunit alpha